MYNSQYTADLIKKLLFKKNITGKQMSTDLGLGVNTLSNIRRGDVKNVETFNLIADYLNCSVDYLLGRTENPNIIADAYINGDNNSIQANVNTGNLTVSNGEPKLEEMEAQLLKYFRQLEFEQKLNMVGDLIKKAKSNNNRIN